MKRKIGQKGFTLIELLVASSIIVVLSAIGLVSFINAGKSARDAKRKADLETVRQALVLYRADNGGSYPAQDGAPNNNRYDNMISALSSGGYISDPTPNDPKDVSPYLYEYGSASSGSTFTLEVRLETTGSDYELTNP